MNLAKYACHHNFSKGRQFREEKSVIRNDFQRDRDRIIHSASFRRLQYKTQVFVNHEGDMYRSRLTHSLEVSQIARGIARSLNCHEDLAEAIALAHDLGHTPFGHAGQDALNKCMHLEGGFEHNLQSLRVVDFLENKYANFRGLNLTYEVREGILKHCSMKNAKKLGEIGKRFILKKQPSLEAQIVNFTDEIAYIHHDIEDGFRSGILDFDILNENKIFKDIDKEIREKFINLNPEQRIHEILRKMMNIIISNLCNQSMANLKKYNPKNPDEIRDLPPLIEFSNDMALMFKQLKKFSRKNLYEHPRIEAMSQKAQRTVEGLFKFFTENYKLIPMSYKDNEVIMQRNIADYIAGMTDRFAEQLASKYL